MVARRLGAMSKQQLAPLLEDEGAPELPGVSLNAGLFRSGPPRSEGVADQAAREERFGPSTQPRRSIGEKLPVGQHRTIELEVLSKRLGKRAGSVPDERHADASACHR